MDCNTAESIVTKLFQDLGLGDYRGEYRVRATETGIGAIVARRPGGNTLRARKAADVWSRIDVELFQLSSNPFSAPTSLWLRSYIRRYAYWGQIDVYGWFAIDIYRWCFLVERSSGGTRQLTLVNNAFRELRDAGAQFLIVDTYTVHILPPVHERIDGHVLHAPLPEPAVTIGDHREWWLGGIRIPDAIVLEKRIDIEFLCSLTEDEVINEIARWLGGWHVVILSQSASDIEMYENPENDNHIWYCIPKGDFPLWIRHVISENRMELIPGNRVPWSVLRRSHR